MARQGTNLIIGVFVILGILLGVVAIIWVGATSYFQKGDTYIAYFDESVQGLQVDSSVKFRGVDKGRVESIQVAPDNRLIGVVMKINMPDNLQKNAVAQLKAAGITGIMFIELDLKKPNAPDLSPKIDFPSEYPIIATRPSEIQQLVAGITEVLQKFKEVDTRAISNQVIATTKAMEDFLKGKKMASILARVDASAGNLEQLTGHANKMIAGVRLEKILGDARETLAGARTLLVTLNGEVQGMQLPATVGRARDLVRQLQQTDNKLRQNSETLELLLQRLYERPSDIMFGKPPKKRWNE
jgi:phospholipid/cholesterol/gamma-HCH transport system substrate-binding protein